MASETISNYIIRHYERWLDYSLYHCGLIGILDEATDILNGVMCSFLQKQSKLLDELLDTERSGCTGLDFFILKMIELNASSPASQCRSRYKPLPVNDNVSYLRLDIEDIPGDSVDRNVGVLDEPHLVRDTLENLEPGDLTTQMSESHLSQDGNSSEWEGPETLKQLYEIYSGVQEPVRERIAGKSMF